MKCSNCGKISPDGSKVCMMCGMPFGKVKYCPNCGNLIDADAIFCPQCGWKHGRNTVESTRTAEKFYDNSPVHVKQKKERRTAWKVFSWIGFIFGLLFAMAYMPSFASLLFLVFSLILMPIEALQNAWGNMKIKGAIKGFLLAALFIIGALVSPTSSDSTKNISDSPAKEPQNTSSEDRSSLKRQETDQVKSDEPTPEENVPLVDSSLDTSGYMNIDANVLFEYGNYLGGQKVVTVITADDVDTYSSMIKAKTSNNSGYFFSIVCEFPEKAVVESIKEGDVITVAGTLKERDPLIDAFSFLETPTANLEDCSIIGLGEVAQELSAGIEDQRKVGEAAKTAYEESVAAQEKEERDSYISQCETVSYSDVERNPDNYKGMLVKFTGRVVQVSEGWFDSVTMRIDSGGNMWYVTYSREEGESRILEDDKITCYGECDGVTSYTTVLGAQVTIPSMKMKYYE